LIFRAKIVFYFNSGTKILIFWYKKHKEATICSLISYYRKLILMKSQILGSKSIIVFVACMFSLWTTAQKNLEMEWWQSLSPTWQEAFRKNLRTVRDINPNTIQLMWQLNELDISGNQGISDLTPLKPLKTLRKLYSNNTNISSLSPLADLAYLEVVEFQGTHIRNLKPLASLTELRRVNAAQTPLRKISSLCNLKKLEIVLCMETEVSRRDIRRFSKKNPTCRVIRDYLH
jgi:Leucine-rich repeat (LRR) protein